MGRQIVENLSRKKIIYNQYANSSQANSNAVLQYTCPSDKTAKINFGYSSTLRNNSTGVSSFAMSLIATKKTSSPQFHSVIAVGKAQASQQDRGQMLQLRPWWNWGEGTPTAGVSTGNQSYYWMGIDSSKYLEYTFDGAGNALGNPYNTIKYHSHGTQNPYNSASMCDAHKDYMIEAGHQIYFSYNVQCNGTPTYLSNQIDIMFEVEEMEAFA